MILTIDTDDTDAMSDLASALLAHTGQGERCSCGETFALPFLPQPYDFWPVAQHLRDGMVKHLREVQHV